MSKILVTGGSGFIGTNIINFYKNENEIINIDIKPPRDKTQIKYWKKLDILNKKELIRLVSTFKPEYIFHMAARTDLFGKTIKDYEANTKGVENIIKAISVTDSIKKVVFASSRLVCEIGFEPKDEFDYKPSTIYGKSKIETEKIIRNSKELNKNWIIVRPTSLWGPWFDIPYKNFFDTIKNKLYIHPKGIEINKKFGFIGNSIYILDKLIYDTSLNNKTVYLSDFKTLEVKEWANIISQCFHNENVKQVPFTILKILAKIGDLFNLIGYKNPPLTSFRLNNLTTNMIYNTNNVEKVVGPLPYDLKKATIITYNWYINN